MTDQELFLFGVLIGSLIFSLIHMCVMAAYRDVLLRKALSDDPTPEQIGSGFYYIVPEHEYVEMSQHSLRNSHD